MAKWFQGQCMDEVQLLKARVILKGEQSWETCETERGSVLHFRGAGASSLEEEISLHREQQGSLGSACCLQPSADGSL